MDKHVPAAASLPTDPDFVKQFELPPGGMNKIYLGKYRESDPRPRFHTHHIPGDTEHAISCKEHKLGDGEVYLLYWTFQNFGDQACTVTVRRQQPDRRIND